MSITAPYNFVPLSKSIFYPPWANDKKLPISHDIPFEDGESGILKLKVTTKSSTFIRNHYEEGDEYFLQTKNKEKVKVSKEFCHIKQNDESKQYYIPATSFKGMIRNIIEINTFSKIQIDEENSLETMSVRDMTPKQYCEDPKIFRMKDCPHNQKKHLFRFPLVATAQRCALLELHKDGSFTLFDAHKPVIIHHTTLANDFKIKDVKKKKTAKEKYEAYGHKKIYVSTKNEGRQIKAYPGNNEAILSFTGDINNKKHEFVFIKNKQIEVNTQIVKNFKTVYFNDEDSVDGQYWKHASKNNLIPVFFITDKSGNITNLGLTQIFKIAYTKTILEAAKQNVKKGKIDFSQTLFGTHSEELGLKGRVFFSHLKSNIIRFEQQPKKIKEQVLGSPNPTYYPNYIRQINTKDAKVNQYTTLMDKDAQISGWKMYPLQNTLQSYDLPTNEKGKVNHDVTTQWKPLDAGEVFEGTVRFHNLKKAEIGALLSALTFHMQGDKYLHNIGMAKPLGYGKIKVEIPNFDGFKHTKKEYLDAFEESMNSWNEKEYDKWNKSKQVQALFFMHNNERANSLRYQQLKNDKGKNDFTDAKQKRNFLHLFRIDKSSQKHTTNAPTKKYHTKRTEQTQLKTYTMQDIKKELGVEMQVLLDFTHQPDLALPKNLTHNSILKEPQAKNLIKKFKSRK